MTSRPKVAVVGPADATEPLLSIARDVGTLLAKSGVVVVTGGLGGVMDAAAGGARAAGGEALGLLPGPDAADAASGITIAVPTGLGQARNVLVVLAADALIAVGGSWGTLSEVALAARLGRPTASVAGWQITDAAGAVTADGPTPAADAAHAVEWVLERIRHH